MSNPLDREIVRKTMRGYEEVNRITEEELRARLLTLTDEEALREFAALYNTWVVVGKHTEEDLAALEEERLQDAIAFRVALWKVARAQGFV
jgi:hypothetical protein